MGERRLIRPAVEAYVKALRADGNLDLKAEPLAQLALRLASLIDSDSETKSVAGWARELRVTLAELAPKEAAGDGDPDAWLKDLDGSVTPIRHAQGS